MTKFMIVLSEARSGTTAFGSMIRQLDGVLWLGEPWNQELWWLPDESRETILKSFENSGHRVEADGGLANGSARANPSGFLDALSESSNLLDYKFVAMKLLWHQLSGEDIRRVIERLDVTTLVLIRDPVDTYISEIKATRTSAWNSLDYTDLKPELDPDHFKDWTIHRKKFLDFIEKNASFIWGYLRYEDLFGNQRKGDKSFSRAMALMGLSAHNEGPTTVKQDRGRFPDQRVSNFNAFQKSLGPEFFDALYSRETTESLRKLVDLSKSSPLPGTAMSASRAQRLRECVPGNCSDLEKSSFSELIAGTLAWRVRGGPIGASLKP